MGSPLQNIRIESGSLSGLASVKTKSLFVESIGQVGQVLVAGASNAIVSAQDIYVAKLESGGGGDGGDNIATLVSPALRLSNLATLPGALAITGVHGELTARGDLEVVPLNAAFEALSMVDAASLARKGKPTGHPNP